ncbi:protein of unknown function [Thermomonospora echinospora]|uniref:DUF397 domain-containing protein n=1 Tax=Thermomonospora echinospora TaxID=1992 RepID=A0A1H5Y2K0_9ACTN|nr:DUF397 domain-containing protein [Thermomonospora echinospora]SEG17917.1 protein of unknown function [Thermomonospora echinospora]
MPLDTKPVSWRKSSHSSMDENSQCVEVAALPIPPSATWRKSAHSSMDENSMCVEIVTLPIGPSPSEWHKSSRSGGEDHAMCVEVAASGVTVAVRDSKDPDGPYLTFAPDQWRALAERIRQGRLDLP